MELRKVTYRMYPGTRQTEKLEELLGLHQRVYNTALEERIRVYGETSKTLGFAAQCKELTSWRKQCEALAAVNAQSLQVTLKRLDLAYAAFFRRVKAGETAGFPRFKPIQRFAGWGYKTHGDGFRLQAGDKMRHGHVRLSGVGMVRVRGQARTPGAVKTAEVQHKGGRWYLSVTVECNPQRASGTLAMGLDWGLESFATVCSSDEKTHSVANPRFLDKPQRQILKVLQQAVSRKKDKRTNNRRKAVALLSAESRRIANRRKDFLHKTSAGLVNQYGLIATEQLSVKNMTASGGAHKRGLNRSILDTAPSTFLNLLKTKAEEAGSLWVEVPTRQVKPSQTCHRCGSQCKKLLSERRHQCDCGASCSRDENAARVMLHWALYGNATGQELSEVGNGSRLAAQNHEIPHIAALVAWVG
ncbi:putative transposase [mine drainage metagenome]|uniref:Putative transposase n=1 Tax=mine drainage metagenome TaxID=410659 RepID=A0A1J5T3C5_9ZZZZ